MLCDWLLTKPSRKGLFQMTNYGPRIEVTHQENVTIIDLLDEEILEEPVINSITESLFSVISDTPKINLLLSFSHVKHFSSSALGMLIRINKRVEESNGQLRLCEIQQTLYEIFTITKLNKLFEIHPERNMAIKSFLKSWPAKPQKNRATASTKWP